MVETRMVPRFRRSKAAQIDYGGDKAPCTIRDISETGAAIEVSDRSATIAEAFTLVVAEDKLKLPRRVVWRKAYKTGVSFK